MQLQLVDAGHVTSDDGRLRAWGWKTVGELFAAEYWDVAMTSGNSWLARKLSWPGLLRWAAEYGSPISSPPTPPSLAMMLPDE